MRVTPLLYVFLLLLLSAPGLCQEEEAPFSSSPEGSDVLLVSAESSSSSEEEADADAAHGGWGVEKDPLQRWLEDSHEDDDDDDDDKEVVVGGGGMSDVLLVASDADYDADASASGELETRSKGWVPGSPAPGPYPSTQPPLFIVNPKGWPPPQDPPEPVYPADPTEPPEAPEVIMPCAKGFPRNGDGSCGTPYVTTCAKGFGNCGTSDPPIFTPEVTEVDGQVQVTPQEETVVTIPDRPWENPIVPDVPPIPGQPWVPPQPGVPGEPQPQGPAPPPRISQGLIVFHPRIVDRVTTKIDNLRFNGPCAAARGIRSSPESRLHATIFLLHDAAYTSCLAAAGVDGFLQTGSEEGADADAPRKLRERDVIPILHNSDTRNCALAAVARIRGAFKGNHVYLQCINDISVFRTLQSMGFLQTEAKTLSPPSLSSSSSSSSSSLSLTTNPDPHEDRDLGGPPVSLSISGNPLSEGEDADLADPDVLVEALRNPDWVQHRTYDVIRHTTRTKTRVSLNKCKSVLKPTARDHRGAQRAADEVVRCQRAAEQAFVDSINKSPVNGLDMEKLKRGDEERAREDHSVMSAEHKANLEYEDAKKKALGDSFYRKFDQAPQEEFTSSRLSVKEQLRKHPREVESLAMRSAKPVLRRFMKWFSKIYVRKQGGIIPIMPGSERSTTEKRELHQRYDPLLPQGAGGKPPDYPPWRPLPTLKSADVYNPLTLPGTKTAKKDAQMWKDMPKPLKERKKRRLSKF